MEFTAITTLLGGIKTAMEMANAIKDSIKSLQAV
jgi:hypothetical protein